MLPITKQPRWKLEQAAVWIATRDPKQVVRYPFARLASGVAAFKADLTKAREDLKKATDAIQEIETEIATGGLIRACDHAEAMQLVFASQFVFASLETTVADAIAIPDSIACDPTSPDFSVLLRLGRALHIGELPAFGDLNGTGHASIDAAIWSQYTLEHLPLISPAKSKVPAETLPLTLRALSCGLYDQSLIKRKGGPGPGFYDPYTRTIGYRFMIENIVVERAAVMRLWPAPGAARVPKTARPSQARIAEAQRDTLGFLLERLKKLVSRPRQPDESTDRFFAEAKYRASGLTKTTFNKVWREVIDELKDDSKFHSSWLPKRGRPQKKS